MAVRPAAFFLYPDQFEFDVGQPQLDGCKDDYFHTHFSPNAEWLHQLSEMILLPGRWNAQLLGYVFEPLPGANKDFPSWGLTVRVAAFVLWVLSVPFAVLSLAVAFPLRCIDHQFRPAFSYFDSSMEDQAQVKHLSGLVLTAQEPLHLRTHNLGFTTSSMSIGADLRHPEERAQEVVDSIVQDQMPPDIIFFQEGFHEDAVSLLCQGIKLQYPHILHTLAPQITGFSSGSIVASKYPIESIKFHALAYMLGPERASARGITRILLNTPSGPLLVYGVHTQALIGEARAIARFNQLEEIRQFMEDDLKEHIGASQILVGDFNTSRVSAWGEDNIGQAEERVFNRLEQYFDDLFLQDHDQTTGKRVRWDPMFLDHDNQAMGEDLEEPSGSWYHGPFADRGFILSSKMDIDRRAYLYPDPQIAAGIYVRPSIWGTQRWRAEQTANTARFDYILVPKGQGKLQGRAEIRRVAVPPQAQSAPTDHLPVDALIWLS
jgi:endonuclease/exonuclease/phosphatase family metal-dependent hydrolase